MFGVKRKTVIDWRREGAPIILVGKRLQAEYSGLMHWLIERDRAGSEDALCCLRGWRNEEGFPVTFILRPRPGQAGLPGLAAPRILPVAPLGTALRLTIRLGDMLALRELPRRAAALLGDLAPLAYLAAIHGWSLSGGFEGDARMEGGAFSTEHVSLNHRICDLQGTIASCDCEDASLKPTAVKHEQHTSPSKKPPAKLHERLCCFSRSRRVR